jgi:hypothetical protein
MKDPKKNRFRTCQFIWKYHSSFEHNVWGWIMLQQHLGVKTKILKSGFINVACILFFGRDDIVKNVFWRFYFMTKAFWPCFQDEFHHFLIIQVFPRKVFSWGTLGWLERWLERTAKLCVIQIHSPLYNLWKVYRCKVTFHVEPSPQFMESISMQGYF